MLSYKNWKMINENLNRTLGLSQVQSLGLVSPIHTEEKKAEEPAEQKHCKYCGKMSKKTMKKEEFDEEDDVEEKEEEEEGDDEEEKEEEEGDDEEEEEEKEEEDGDDEEEEESDEDEVKESVSHTKKHKNHKKQKKHMKHMKCMKCMKKMKHMDGDVDGDGKKDFSDIMAKRMIASGMPKKVAIAKAKKVHQKHSKKKKKMNESSDANWMNGVFGSNPQQKFYDGIS